MNIRQNIESFVYGYLDFLTERIYREGQECEYLGVKGLYESEKFVKGQLIHSLANLCLYYRRGGDAARFDRVWERLVAAVDLLQDDRLRTWGMLSALRGCYELKKAGVFDRLPDQSRELLENRTRYTDFYDTETNALKGGLPTNYYQVAMACAGLREAMGFDAPGVCDRIKDRLIRLMEQGGGGWMDEQIPFGRYDRYSLMVTSEFSDTLDLIGREVPRFILDNLHAAAMIALASANRRGDGVIYGRSLSVHGDCAYLEILSSALRHRLLDENQIPVALAYAGAILDKTEHFWFDRSRMSFNLWFDGRTTNSYRQSHRVLEVNLDMMNHLLSTLANLDAAGLADREPGQLPADPAAWRVLRTDFQNIPGHLCTLYTLRRGGLYLQLPLVGLGNRVHSAAYLPFPALAERLEAYPDAFVPFLTPLYTLADGRQVMPVQYYSAISEETGEDRVTVTVRGTLADVDFSKRNPSDTGLPFTAVYRFEGASLEVLFDTAAPVAAAVMSYGMGNRSPRVKFFGFGSVSERRVVRETMYHTPHGAHLYLTTARGTGGRVGYRFDRLPE